MSVLTMSSKGQIVLPAALRRRMGMGAGAKIEVIEESDGVRLKVVRGVGVSDVSALAAWFRPALVASLAVWTTSTPRRSSPERRQGAREVPRH